MSVRPFTPSACVPRRFRCRTLARHGLRWVWPEVPLAHPLDGGRAAVLHRDLHETAAGLGADGTAWTKLMQPLLDAWPMMLPQLLGPLLTVPRHPIAMARFGLKALQPTTLLTRRFHTDAAAALFGGCAAHAMLPLSRPLTSAFGLVLAAAAHADGWPLAAGGSQAVADALGGAAGRTGRRGAHRRDGAFAR